MNFAVFAASAFVIVWGFVLIVAVFAVIDRLRRGRARRRDERP